MKKLISLLLVLVLLLSMAACVKQTPVEQPEKELLTEDESAPEPIPNPEPEPEPIDPRILWAEAEAARIAYDSMEVERHDEIVIASGEEDFTVENLTVIRGNELGNRMMKYELVTTGDEPRELYYANGVLNLIDGDSAYACKLGVDGFIDFLEEEMPALTEELFERVELIEAETGWKIAFSEPREQFVDDFVRKNFLSSTVMKEGSLEVSGTVTLDEEGRYESIEVETSCAVLYYGTIEATYVAKQTDRWLSHDEEVTVIVPSKVETYYTDGLDIRISNRLIAAVTFLELAVGAEYTTSLTFEGTLDGKPLSMQYDTDTVFLRDIPKRTVQISETLDINCIWNGSTTEVSQQLDFADGTVVFRENDTVQQVTESQEYFYALASEDFLSFIMEDEPQNKYLFPTVSSADGLYTVSFSEAGYSVLALYDMVLQLLNPEFTEAIYYLTDYELIRNSGTVVIEEASQAFRTVAYDLEASFTLEDGTVFVGTLIYERNFLAYNDDVTLEPGAGIGQET